MPIDTREQGRRRALIKEHYAAENDHDWAASWTPSPTRL